MEIVHTVNEMQKQADTLRQNLHKITFVPTMGFLHEGHLSLVRAAKQYGDVVVVSIFVNPAQFAPHEDLDKYPRDFNRDQHLLEAEGVDIIFYPRVSEMYPRPYHTYVQVSDLTEALCGLSRPEHFKGVTTVVTKLFNIVKPHSAVFGQKDFQQSQVIKQMVIDLNMDVEIIRAPIVRETDGLAMSSRNKYLDPQQRKDARVLNSSLQTVRQMVQNGILKSTLLKEKIQEIISAVPCQIDYIEIVDAETFKNIDTVKDNTLFALAVKIGNTRLIDNFYIELLEKEKTWQ